MIYVLFMAIVCAIAVGNMNAVPTEISVLNSVGAVLLCVAAPIFMALFAVAICDRRKMGILKFDKRSSRLMHVHSLSWLLSAINVVFWAHWPATVREKIVGDIVLVDELLIIAPLLISWLLSWVVLYRWFADERPPVGRARFIWQQTRLTLLLAWVPVLWFCTCHDVLEAMIPNVDSTEVNLLCVGLSFFGLVFFFPRLLGFIWDTNPLPEGALRQRLEEMAKSNRLSIREIHIWQTDHRIANAAVAGILPSTRRVFLSDALVDCFSDDEIEAAFAHELGHARHHHSVFRIALLAVPLSVFMLASALMPNSALAAGGEMAFLPTVAVCIYLIVGLGWYSRRMEHEADLWACQQLAADYGKATALKRYVDVLFRLCDHRHVNRGSWLHPGHRCRRNFLIRCLSNSAFRRSFQREMRWLAAFLVVVAVLPLLLLVVSQA